jgi:isopentenyl diphosphate isomerase/L-lactate dehydrogenase-like FMN-dependent dehydrogenase
MPMRVTQRNFPDLAGHPRWLFGTMGRYLLKNKSLPRFVNIAVPESLTRQQAAGFSRKNDAIDMNFLRRVRDIWPRTLIVKGILQAEDAKMVADAGADGVIVSNHGGIANDCAPAAIEVLPSIAKEVSDRATIIIDGGIRRGSDIVKCIGLGAHGVAVGRATLYGAAAAGENGAYRASEILFTELRRTMGVLAITRLEQVTRDHIVVPPNSLISVI